MENQNLKNYLINNPNKTNLPNIEINKLSLLDKKFTEMNSDLALIYDSTIKENNENLEKNIEKANNVIDILKLLLDDTEDVKKDIMEVLKPESKTEMQAETEEKKFEMDFDLTKISSYNNTRNKPSLTKDNNNYNGYNTNNKKVIFDYNDLNFLLGSVKLETKTVSDDITNLHNTIGNYKERIKEALNIHQNNPNLSAQKHPINNPNFNNPIMPIGNINVSMNRNITTIPDNIQQQSNNTINVNK